MIRIGIICPSEIALRRFLPALSSLQDFKFMGVAIADYNEWEGANADIIKIEQNKAYVLIEQYGGKIFNSYMSMIESNEIDALYLPLPPSLHYKWSKLALLEGKHILIEKPATISLNDTQDIISIAKKNNLAIHENYMFAFHNQLSVINKIIQDGEIGEVRLYRISFGFPRRASSDFRYNKNLGGGALFDCGGYTIKYASVLLGGTPTIVYANSNYIDGFDVDIYGSAALKNENGTTVQIAFGMDNSYKCELEVWGSKGSLSSGRVLTAPSGFIPEVLLKFGISTEIRMLPEDDAFKKSIQKFKECINFDNARINNYYEIEKQAELVDDFINKAKQ